MSRRQAAIESVSMMGIDDVKEPEEVHVIAAAMACSSAKQGSMGGRTAVCIVLK